MVVSAFIYFVQKSCNCHKYMKYVYEAVSVCIVCIVNYLFKWYLKMFVVMWEMGIWCLKSIFCAFFPPQVCKSCIVKHFFYSNKCPTCSIVVHQTQPLYNIRWVWLFWSYRNHLGNFQVLFSKGVSTASSSSCCDLADFYARSVLSGLMELWILSRQFWFRWLYRVQSRWGERYNSEFLQPVMVWCCVSANHVDLSCIVWGWSTTQFHL